MAGTGASAVTSKGVAAKPKVREGSAQEAAAADSLETQVRSLFDERLAKDGEVILRVSPETPLGKGGLATPSAGRASGVAASGPAAARSPEGVPGGSRKAEASTLKSQGLGGDRPGSERTEDEREKLWDWTGPRGPQQWSRLDPANLLCAQGKMQSPPSISEAMVIPSTMRMPTLSFGETGFSWKREGPLWTLQLGAGAQASWREDTWSLEAIQFRFPGEPFVGGNAPAGSIHLIHRRDSRFLILVVSLAGSDQAPRHAGLTTLMQRFPMDSNDRPDWSGLKIDVRTFIPAAADSGTAFPGSLSHPPCSEGVFWLLFDTPLVLRNEQIREMEVLVGRGHRPIQASGTRLVLRLQAQQP